MDPQVRQVLLEMNRPRESFRNRMLQKSSEKVKKELRGKLKVSRVLQKVKENIPKCSCTSNMTRAFCTELFPFWGVMKKYSLRRYLLADFVAGITVGIIHIPQGMAYGFLTNLPPVYGLYTSFFPVLLYFFFGSSNKISMGTFAVTSLMVGAVVQRGFEATSRVQSEMSASVGTFSDTNATLLSSSTNFSQTNYSILTRDGPLSDLPSESDEEISIKVGYAMSLSFLVGLIQFLLGTFRFGFLAYFMSDPLISGFTTGAAIHVFSSQVKYLFGVQVPTYDGAFKLIYFYRDFFKELHNVNPVTAVASVTCIFVLILIKEGVNNNPSCQKDLPVPVPIELFVVIAATVISHYTRIHTEFQVDVVGTIPVGLPPPNIKNLRYTSEVIGDAITISFVAFATSYAMAKILAEKNNEEVDANQELVANGICNLVGAIFSSFCSAASLSRSLVQENAGGRTQVTGLFSSVLLLVVLLYFGPMFANLPQCILACIVIVTLKGMFKQFYDLVILWRLCKRDFAVWFVTFTATVILDVGLGLMVGVIFALYFILRNTQRPHICVMGRIPGTSAYRDIKLSRTLIQIPGIKIFRFESNLYFANAEQFRDRLYDRTGLNPRKLKTKKQKALYKALLQRKREQELEEIMQASIKKSEKKKKEIKRSPIEDDIDTDIGDELTEEQEGVLMKEKEELASLFSKAWMPPVHTVVLDFSVISYIDTVAIKVLTQIMNEFKEVGIKVFLAGCREDVRKIIKKSEFYRTIGYNCLYFTIHEAVVISKELNEEIGDTTLKPEDVMFIERESEEARLRQAASQAMPGGAGNTSETNKTDV